MNKWALQKGLQSVKHTLFCYQILRSQIKTVSSFQVKFFSPCFCFLGLFGFTGFSVLPNNFGEMPVSVKNTITWMMAITWSCGSNQSDSTETCAWIPLTEREIVPERREGKQCLLVLLQSSTELFCYKSMGVEGSLCLRYSLMCLHKGAGWTGRRWRPERFRGKEGGRKGQRGTWRQDRKKELEVKVFGEGSRDNHVLGWVWIELCSCFTVTIYS